jgi:putative tricarboxylic transport membrane protein
MENVVSEKNPAPGTVEQILRASIGPFLIFAVAVYFYSLACRIGPAPMGQLGPQFWPKMVLIFLMISCVIKFGEIVSQRRKLDQDVETRPKMNNVKLTLMIVLLVVTVFAIDYIGFALANFLFFLAFLWLVGLRRIPSLLMISGFGTVGMLYMFVKIVYLPLPKGVGFFEDISLYVYHALFIM